METLGVPPKQKERARQIFSKSAQSAGIIDAGMGRFVKLATGAPPPADPIPNRQGHTGGGGKRSGGGRKLA
jgi:hypothetical protein